MAVYDRWHRAPRDGDEPCRDHGQGKAKLYPSAVHGQGDRWQVRYRDLEGRQRSRSFAAKTGKLPGIHADAFDALVQRELDTGGDPDPRDADLTLQAYAEQWRASRTHDTVTADHLRRRLANHVYEDPPGSGKTRRGGAAIGQRKLRELARRPTIAAAWIASMPLRESSARLVVTDVSAIFRAAIDDGIVSRDPTRAASVTRPGRGRVKARPWTREQVAAMAAALPPRLAIIPWLGAATGMRQAEIFALGADDITWLGRDPRILVRRQLKPVGGRLFFAPVKNRREHTVPLAASLAPRLARHLQLHPAVAVTLPWHDLRDRERHGRPMTVRLLLSDGRGRPLDRNRFNVPVWWRAQEAAGITPRRERGEKRVPAREDGMHVLRHTAASAWLHAGVDVVKVAAWMGDTPAMILGTYAHLMPGDDGAAGRAATDEFLGAPVIMGTEERTAPGGR